MTDTPSLPRFTDIERALKKADSNFDAASAHGLLCGFICATSGKTDSEWKQLIAGKKNQLDNLAALEELYEVSYHLLSEFSFEFNLLLPEDSVDINQRAELLGLWCQGFVTGLEKCGFLLTKREPSDVTEALDDIIEIAQISFGDITDTEEDETAYFELVEHVRLSVLLIFNEIRSGEDSSPENGNDVLH